MPKEKKESMKNWRKLSETGYYGYCEEGTRTHYADYIRKRKPLPFAEKLCKRHLKMRMVS